jgi:hypothetical protein
MSALNRFMLRGAIPPQVHGVLDYPLAAVLIAGPLVLNNDCGWPELRTCEPLPLISNSVLGVRRAIGRRPCNV